MQELDSRDLPIGRMDCRDLPIGRTQREEEKSEVITILIIFFTNSAQYIFE